MHIQIFNIPLTDSRESMTELNRFLAGHKVLEVEQICNINRPKSKKSRYKLIFKFKRLAVAFIAF